MRVAQGIFQISLMVVAIGMTSPLYADSHARPVAPVPPVSPQDSLKLMHVPEGFEVELVAAEPLVMDPVAIAWGADGKLWVVEMADYPSGMDGKMKPGGRVRFLESTRHDGHYDKSTLFLEGLNFPTGIVPWRKGVIITAAPQIIYAEDTDGDGKADKRVTLYSGFKEGNAQLRVNGLRWGADGWLYGANGWSGGIARSEKTGQTVNLSGHDFRIKPDEGLIELQSGMSEFGRDCDDDQNWFGCDNSNPLFHFPFDDVYLRRNSAIAGPVSKIQLAIPANPKLYAASKPQKRFHTFEHVDHFTSACGMTIYRDDLLFPRDGTEHAFVCEPVHNLVHHLVLTPAGATFSAARAPEESHSEFLASEDQWCRPVMARTGPDGALWVVDMYRYIIEHPDWLPPEGQKELAAYWRLGEDRGRIYRIVPKGKRPREVPNLARLSATDLAASLDSPSGWQRDTAQQLIVWNHESAAVPILNQLVDHCQNPLARLQALCALDQLQALDPRMIEHALHDSDPAVRRQAVRLAETHAQNAPSLIASALKLVEGDDAKVRLQLACTLGQWDDPRAAPALSKLAMCDAGDALISGAVMSSANRHYGAIAHAVVESHQFMSGPLVQGLLAIASAKDDRPVVAELLSLITAKPAGGNAAEQMELLATWLDYPGQHGTSIQKLSAHPTDELCARLGELDAVFAAARQRAADNKSPANERLAAIRLLGRQKEFNSRDLSLCASLLHSSVESSEFNRALIAAIGRTGDPTVPQIVLNDWTNKSPLDRQASIDLLLSRQNWTIDLLHAIASNAVSASDLDVARRSRLLQTRSQEVLELARKVLGRKVDTDRQKAVDSYGPALSLVGDVKRGQEVFRKNCATCHRIGEIGNDIGPDLRSVGSWTPQMMLVAILDPNRQVEPRYLSYTVTLDDGEALFGVISDESAGSLTLKTIDGQQRAILRRAVRSLVCTNRSLMPEGLEAAMSMQDVADVIAFVQRAE